MDPDYLWSLLFFVLKFAVATFFILWILKAIASLFQSDSKSEQGELEVIHLNEVVKKQTEWLSESLLSPLERELAQKEKQRVEKAEQKQKSKEAKKALKQERKARKKQKTQELKASKSSSITKQLPEHSSEEAPTDHSIEPTLENTEGANMLDVHTTLEEDQTEN